MRRLTIALALFAIAGCYHTSPPVERDPLAMSPRGVTGEVVTSTHTYAGELLAITANDLTMLSENRIVVIPFAIMGKGDFGKIDVMLNGAPSTRHFDQLRYASRYPYGIPAPALRDLLAYLQRPKTDTVR
jgi:hypothetical protein